MHYYASKGSFGSKEKWRKVIGIGKFPMVILFMPLIQRNGGTISLILVSKGKCRNYKIHLELSFKFISPKYETNILTGKITF